MTPMPFQRPNTPRITAFRALGSVRNHVPPLIFYETEATPDPFPAFTTPQHHVAVLNPRIIADQSPVPDLFFGM